jgi:peptide-methionine (S)-S-oxide reductase
MKYIQFSMLGLLLLMGCSQSHSENANRAEQTVPDKPRPGESVAFFASGCFWCTEEVFENLKGVRQVISGYAGGKEKNPTYEQVSAGQTGHAEAVQVYYDPKVISYATLVKVFFASHDPTTLNRQGPDTGKQYRSAIFYQNDEEKKAAEQEVERVNSSGRYPNKIVTQIVPFVAFYPAEDYHQDYYRLNPGNSYIQNVSKPKVEKFKKEFKDLLKQKQ